MLAVLTFTIAACSHSSYHDFLTKGSWNNIFQRADEKTGFAKTEHVTQPVVRPPGFPQPSTDCHQFCLRYETIVVPEFGVIAEDSDNFGLQLCEDTCEKLRVPGLGVARSISQSCDESCNSIAPGLPSIASLLVNQNPIFYDYSAALVDSDLMLETCNAMCGCAVKGLLLGNDDTNDEYLDQVCEVVDDMCNGPAGSNNVHCFLSAISKCFFLGYTGKLEVVYCVLSELVALDPSQGVILNALATAAINAPDANGILFQTVMLTVEENGDSEFQRFVYMQFNCELERSKTGLLSQTIVGTWAANQCVNRLCEYSEDHELCARSSCDARCSLAFGTDASSVDKVLCVSQCVCEALAPFPLAVISRSCTRSVCESFVCSPSSFNDNQAMVAPGFPLDRTNGKVCVDLCSCGLGQQTLGAVSGDGDCLAKVCSYSKYRRYKKSCVSASCQTACRFSSPFIDITSTEEYRSCVSFCQCGSMPAAFCPSEPSETCTWPASSRQFETSFPRQRFFPPGTKKDDLDLLFDHLYATTTLESNGFFSITGGNGQVSLWKEFCPLPNDQHLVVEFNMQSTHSEGFTALLAFTNLPAAVVGDNIFSMPMFLIGCVADSKLKESGGCQPVIAKYSFEEYFNFFFSDGRPFGGPSFDVIESGVLFPMDTGKPYSVSIGVSSPFDADLSDKESGGFRRIHMKMGLDDDVPISVLDFTMEDAEFLSPNTLSLFVGHGGSFLEPWKNTLITSPVASFVDDESFNEHFPEPCSWPSNTDQFFLGFPGGEKSLALSQKSTGDTSDGSGDGSGGGGGPPPPEMYADVTSDSDGFAIEGSNIQIALFAVDCVIPEQDVVVEFDLTSTHGRGFQAFFTMVNTNMDSAIPIFMIGCEGVETGCKPVVAQYDFYAYLGDFFNPQRTGLNWNELSTNDIVPLTAGAEVHVKIEMIGVGADKNGIGKEIRMTVGDHIVELGVVGVDQSYLSANLLGLTLGNPSPAGSPTTITGASVSFVNVIEP